jgi:hypothetical protein
VFVYDALGNDEDENSHRMDASSIELVSIKMIEKKISLCSYCLDDSQVFDLLHDNANDNKQ